MKFKRENYYTKNEDNVIETISLEDLKKAVDNMVYNVERNNKCPCDVPVFFNYDRKEYSVSNWALGLCFSPRYEVKIDFSTYNEIKFIAPDSRPEDGEYWNSRGATDLDCSGFVVSKAAGERLRRMVRLVLEKDDTKSWLDFREYEPNWIQFKFMADEFDVEKLDKMARANNNVLTIDILKICKKK